MKIKLFILTYNNPEHLNQTLNSLYSTTDTSRLEIYILNNHSNFRLNPEFFNKGIHIINNSARPDWSTGHPSRSWNQCIMHGFKSLKTPDCDLLIHIQDDVNFEPNWLDNLIRAHYTLDYTFIMDGIGDALCSYTPEAVRSIGLWEERYCNLGWGEFDYQIKSVIYNGRRTSITTDHPLGPWNRLPMKLVTCPTPNEGKRNDKLVGNPYHLLSRSLFIERWGHHPETYPLHWYSENRKTTLTKNWILYPYFELDISDLDKKNYEIPVELLNR